jgi:transcriptional regulator with XRE-family HTH domain
LPPEGIPSTSLKHEWREKTAEYFGANLRIVRRREGLSQEQLGVRASLHRTEIGLLESGERACRIDTLIRLAGAMAVPPGELLEGIDWVPAEDRPGQFSFSIFWPARLLRPPWQR